MSAGAASRDHSVRVATMNLWGTRGDWAQRRRLLIEGFGALDPDLCTFQETIVTEVYDQVRDILGDGYHIVHQSRRAADGQGVSIASRWPLRHVRELDLHVTERTDDFACTTMMARTSTPVGPLLLVNHFPSWKLDLEAEREAQAVIAARAVEAEATTGTHVVLAGDLDADPAAASTRFLTGRQSLQGTSVCYRDAWDSAHADSSGHTYTPENPLMVERDWPFRRIDYVLVRCDDRGPTLAVAGCRRLFDQPQDGVWASDHSGLVADLRAWS